MNGPTPRSRHEIVPFTSRHEPLLLRASVLVNGGTSVGPGYHDILHCVRRDDGAIRWRFGERWSAIELLSRPVHADGTIFVATSSGTLFALDERTGAVRWQSSFREGSYVHDDFLSGDPCVVARAVLFGDSCGCLRAFSCERGELRRELRLDPSMLAVEHHQDLLWVSGREGFVAALDPVTWTQRWRCSVGRALSRPVLPFADVVLARLEGDELIALSRRDGSPVWRAGSIGGVTPRASRGTHVFAATTGGELARIHLASGQVEVRLRGELPQLVGALALVDEFVYVETVQGIVELSLADETPRLFFPEPPGREPAQFVIEGDQLFIYRTKRLKGYLSQVQAARSRWSVRVGDYDLT